MKSSEFVIQFPEGLHMRPAGRFAKVAGKYESDVTIVADGKNINAKSVISIVAACIKHGTQIEVRCEGSDEEQAMEALKSGIEAGLGEK